MTDDIVNIGAWKEKKEATKRYKNQKNALTDRKHKKARNILKALDKAKLVKEERNNSYHHLVKTLQEDEERAATDAAKRMIKELTDIDDKIAKHNKDYKDKIKSIDEKYKLEP